MRTIRKREFRTLPIKGDTTNIVVIGEMVAVVSHIFSMLNYTHFVMTRRLLDTAILKYHSRSKRTAWSSH